MAAKPKSALIVGHTGQDGTLLWHTLLKKGYQVHGLSSRLCSDSSSTAPINGPVLTDRLGIRAYLARVIPDEIYYLAAYHRSSETRDQSTAATEWDKSYEVNVLGFFNILEAVREASPQSRIFYAASSLVFGDCPIGRLHEESPLDPSGVYGVTKATSLHMAKNYRQRHNLFVTCGILFNHESHHRAKQYLSRRVIEGCVDIRKGIKESLELGSLNAIVDWSHAADFVEGFHASLQAEQSDEYVFASGEGRTVREFVEIVFNRAGLDWEKYVIVNPSRTAGQNVRRVGDPSRLYRQTGWKPLYDFESMIVEIMSHFT